jgi:hypothetical protein
MYTSPQRSIAGIGSGSLDALRVQLFKMSPQQLQAFAMANQDDAVKLGLAAEADKVHKTHTQEHMALMSGQQPQPPVAQQILQSIGQPPQGQPQQGMPPQSMPPQGQAPMPPQGMPPQGQMPPQGMPPQGMADGGYLLPEDQGIATLPVGNMDFAEGGIVAFGSGGDVPGYAGGVFTGKPEDYVYTGGIGQPYYVDAPYNPRNPSPLIPLKGRKFATKEEAVNAIKALSNPLSAVPTALAPTTPPINYDPATATRRSMYADNAAPPPPPPPPLKPVVEPGLPAITPTPFERTTLPNVSVAGQTQMIDEAMPKSGEIVDPLAKEKQELNDARTQAAARQVNLFEQEVQKRKPAFEDRIKKLDEKETRVNTMADHNFNMSLLEAGLAMMSGDSPHAFVNIGKGAQVGMKSYAEGQAKIEAARDKMEEARARIEEFRRSEDMMTNKERRAYLRDYENTFVAGKELMYQGAKEAYGMKREDVRAALAAQQAREATQAQITSSENLGITSLKSHENIAKAQMQNNLNIAQLPGATERILSNPALFSRQLELSSESKMPRLYEAYVKAMNDPMSGDKTAAKYPTFEVFLADYERATGGNKGSGFVNQLPGNAPVLKSK